MFILDREEALGKNELPISMVMDIIENRAGYCFFGENKNLLTVWTKDNAESFSAIIKNDKIKIIKINGEKCNILFQKNKNCGYVINEELDFKFQYNAEELDNGISRIAVMQKMDKKTFYQAYLKKNEDALIIMHSEEIDKESFPKDVECDENFSIAIANTNLINTSEENIQYYAKEQALGERNSKDLFYEDEEDFEEELLEVNDYEDSEEDLELEDYEQALAQYEKEFCGFAVIENGDLIDGIESYEMIEDVYAELLDKNIYLDESTIRSIEDIFDQIKELSEIRKDLDELNDPSDIDENQDR